MSRDGSRSEFTNLPGGRYHLRHWGDEGAPLLLMLHGWMDVSSTFQFLVEELRGRWHVVAPDWLGYGHSEWRGRPYWLAELLVDLDVLADRLSPDAPLSVVGHSMGGNIASLWGGAKPERLAHLVLLDSFGHPSGDFSAPERLYPIDLYSQWLREGRRRARQPRHANREAFVQRLMEANRRLTPERADRLADGLGLQADDGSWTVAVDPWHRSTFNHLIHHHEHFLGAWERIACPALWVTGAESATLRKLQGIFGGDEALTRRMHRLRNLQSLRLPQAGHNLHHDQPRELAEALEAFLAKGRATVAAAI